MLNLTIDQKKKKKKKKLKIKNRKQKKWYHLVIISSLQIKAYLEEN